MPVEWETDLQKNAAALIARGEVPALLDAAQNVVIAYTMGWDMEGVMKILHAIVFRDDVVEHLNAETN